MSISTQTPKALYQQVKDHILEQIASGEWPPDTRIPSENELVRIFKVSRMTVNRALQELTTSGRLVRLQGVGTYVAHPKPITALFEIQSIDDEIAAQGGVHSCDIQLLAEEKAYPELAAAMEIPVGTPVFHSIIVHKKNDIPVMLADRYINPLSAPDYLKQDFTATTPAKFLLRTVPLTNVEHIIESILPDAVTQRLLAIGPHEPCLVLHRQTWEGDHIATHSRMTYPGSRYRVGGRFKPLQVHYAKEEPAK
jgi:GntR family transcriptional regulator, histidine utilization repressor